MTFHYATCDSTLSVPLHRQVNTAIQGKIIFLEVVLKVWVSKLVKQACPVTEQERPMLLGACAMCGVITTRCIASSVVHFVQLGCGQWTKCLMMCLHHDVDLLNQVLVHIRIQWELEGNDEQGNKELRVKDQHTCVTM